MNPEMDPFIKEGQIIYHEGNKVIAAKIIDLTGPQGEHPFGCQKVVLYRHLA